MRMEKSGAGASSFLSLSLFSSAMAGSEQSHPPMTMRPAACLPFIWSRFRRFVSTAHVVK